MTTAARLAQVNLYNASLVPKREQFSARQIAAGVILAALAMVAVAVWATLQMRTLRQEVDEQAKLLAGRAAGALAAPTVQGQSVPTPQEVAALEQALRSKQASLQARRAARDALKRGMAGPDSGPSALMRRIAESIPQEAWLTEIRAVGGSVELSGKTLDPEAVDTWLSRLRASGLLAETPAPTVRAERIETAEAAGRRAPAYTFGISATLANPLAQEGGQP